MTATLVGRGYLVFVRHTGSAYGVAEASISFVALSGVYGYAFQQSLGPPQLWRFVFVVVAIGWMFHFVAPDSRMAIQRVGKLRGISAIVTGQLILLPGIIALFRYAFGSTRP